MDTRFRRWDDFIEQFLKDHPEKAEVMKKNKPSASGNKKGVRRGKKKDDRKEKI